MKLPIPFRVRTLVALIALAALTLGAAIGWVHHREHDSQLELDARMSRQIAWHLRQSNHCRAAEAGGLAYPKPDRQQLFREHVTIFQAQTPHSLTGWAAEARLHDDWATGMQDGVGAFYIKDSNVWSWLDRILDFFD